MANSESDLIWRLDNLPVPNTTVLLATARDEHDPTASNSRSASSPTSGRRCSRANSGTDNGSPMESTSRKLRSSELRPLFGALRQVAR